MYGRLEKQKGAYQVTMKLLDVRTKKVEKSSSDVIPVSQATNAAELQGWAKKIYGKLTGETSTGIVAVRLHNADHGTILINGEEKGNITNGAGQVAGLNEGKYKLAVESEGFHRWEQDVTVDRRPDHDRRPSTSRRAAATSRSAPARAAKSAGPARVPATAAAAARGRSGR